MSAPLDAQSTALTEAEHIADRLDDLSDLAARDGDPHFAATIAAIGALLRACAEGRQPPPSTVADRAGAPLH